MDKITGQILDQYFGLNVSESVKQLLLLERLFSCHGSVLLHFGVLGMS
jgi:hypothetical protein